MNVENGGNGKSDGGDRQTKLGSEDAVALVVGPAVAALACFIVWEVLPPGAGRAATPVYVVLFIAFVGAIGYFSYRTTASLRSRSLPARALVASLAAWIVVLAVLYYVARPPDESLGRRACQFGIAGFAKGTVWFKVDPPEAKVNEGREPQDYTINVVWGAATLEDAKYSLRGPTYFTFQQNDLKSPGADISVDPPDAKISCGAGRPPRGETRIDITGTDWKVSE